MKVIEYSDVESFLERTRPFLESDEALYGMALGTAERLVQGYRFGDKDPWFAVVEEGQWLRAIVMQTPPRPMILAAAELEAIGPLIQHIRDAGHDISGVVGPADTSPFFTKRWAHIHGVEHHVHMNMHLFCLDKVIAPENPPAGKMVTASLEDMEWLAPWTIRFIDECHLPPADSSLPNPATHLVEKGKFFLWKDATGPKAMAAFTRETPASHSISWVYTPEEFRGKGYASALVATLSQHALDTGKKFTSLNTDVSNPTSNKIYQEIGYRHYCDMQRVDFGAMK
ncbi:MAG: GNAT family N-acetyltransferase [Planctomycetota bacterium]|nr:GNAT family N-acetyltransferase [Planctomycetota bacterium]